MTTDSTILSVDDLSVIHTASGKHLLNEISFSIKQGEWIGLVGHSGAGKSTLMYALPGLLPQGVAIAKGSIVFDTKELTRASGHELAEIRGKSLSMIFQDPLASLNPVISCGVQVGEPLRIHSKYSARKRYEQVIKILQEVGFQEPERIYQSMPRKLSGGQRQRIMLAMATILRPKLLIADEPTSALDHEAAKHLLEVITRLQKQQGLSVLLISHDRELVDRHANRLLFMRKGRLHTRNTIAHPVVKDHTAHARNQTRQPLLTVRSAAKSFTRPALLGKGSRIDVFKDISFNVYPGEIIGIVGMSGTGKTTLGRCIAGLETIDGGEIQLAGRKIKKIRPSLRQQTPHPVQIIYQTPYASLHPKMPVGQAIADCQLPISFPGQRRQNLA